MLVVAVHGSALWPWKRGPATFIDMVAARSLADQRFVIVPPMLTDAPLGRVHVSIYRDPLSMPVRPVLKSLGLISQNDFDGIGTVVVYRSQVTPVSEFSDAEKRAAADLLASGNPEPQALFSSALQSSGTYWTIEWSRGAWRGVLVLLTLYVLVAAALWCLVLAVAARWHRRQERARLRRGSCPRCTYPLNGASACPECGTQRKNIAPHDSRLL